MSRELLEALSDLGFTSLEARAYLTLVDGGPATAYAVARETGANKANTYKALEALARKGAVALEDDETRVWSAVPHEELLAALEHDHRARTALARRLLRSRPRRGDDDRVLRLHAPSAVFERARGMLGEATDRVLIDAFPAPLEELVDAVTAAAERGVTAAARTYGDHELGSVRVFPSEDPAIADHWPGQWLAVAVDARQLLLAYLSDDLTEVHQAIWSASPHLALAYTDAMSAELVLGDALRSFARDPRAAAEILARAGEDARRYSSSGSPGQRFLLDL